ncbi:FAD-dependent monooxygenase [Renibacterium salmoninarum ATCC 33209]|uniref:FAD-dependent monooxygenase n=2 Tax=Renibacterium salmoninarum TaxID=1646 RepID=A9WU13_RENSM|nr:FAD-dependent monooxygenase [Renibacterium salmoninarum ATCC 33209]
MRATFSWPVRSGSGKRVGSVLSTQGPPFGMRGLSIPTVEALYRRGLLADIAVSKAPNAPAKVASADTPQSAKPRRQAGHFAGIPFDEENIDSSRWPYRLPNPAESTVGTTMERVESALTARALELGVEIKRDAAVEGFSQSDEGVRVNAAGEVFQGKWLVGCDGGRSTVRKAGAFEFGGTDPEFTGYSVQVKISDPDKLNMGRIYTPTGMYFQSQPGIIAMVAFDGGSFHRSEAITLEHVQEVLRHISGTEVTLTALELAATWTDRTYQSTNYRNGRVLIAGDAAHIHSPLGGQGLNLGLGDAMNLGWKLAATIRGTASSTLLDSYASERHPIGAKVLNWSRAQVALMRPSQSSRALETMIRDLIGTRDGATYFAEQLWGVSLRYDLAGNHPLIGRSLPDFEFADGTRLGPLLKDGLGALLNFTGNAELRLLSERLGNSISYFEGQVQDNLGLSAVLVRLDGFVAWATDGEPDVAEIDAALSEWL